MKSGVEKMTELTIVKYSNNKKEHQKLLAKRASNIRNLPS